MRERRLKNVPVVDEAFKPIGILNAQDARQALLGAVEKEEALQRDHVHGPSPPPTMRRVDGSLRPVLAMLTQVSVPRRRTG